MRYKKKPVIIEAIQWLGDNFIEIDNFITIEHETYPCQGIVKVPTLEGIMTANKGDYIIKGINGEFYPCKEDIFLKTYELVEDIKIVDKLTCPLCEIELEGKLVELHDMKGSALEMHYECPKCKLKFIKNKENKNDR